jgi:MFS family permease
MAAVYFSGTLLVFWIFQNGYGFLDIILYFLLTFFIGFLGIFYLPKKELSAKKTIFWGIIFNLAYVLILIKIFHPIQLLLSAIVSGLNIVYFWIPVNTMYFKYSSEEKRGLNSGLFFLMTPIIGITLQPLTGVVAEKFGFEIMFSIGILLYLIPLFLIRYLPDFKWSLEMKEDFKSLKFNATTFFQGIASRINYTLIGVFTLFFITSPIGIGNFFGYLALIAALASVLNGYISDKTKNRKFFFYLFTSLAVISFIPLAFAKNPYIWGLFAGISNLCIYLANPFWFSFNLDFYKEKGVLKTMILREVFLNFGYIINLLVVFFVFYFTESIKITLLSISLIVLFFPFFSYLQKVYLNKNV